jgi:hypothetical protein
MMHGDDDSSDGGCVVEWRLLYPRVVVDTIAVVEAVNHFAKAR